MGLVGRAWDLAPLVLAAILAYNLDDMATKGNNGGGRKRILDDENVRALFLSALGESGELAPSAAVAGISRQTVYDHLERDPAFAEECDAVVGKLRQQAHETLKRIAVDGVAEPVLDKDGKVVGEKRKYDVRALLRLIERHDRQWRTGIDINQKVEVKGKVDISHMPPEDKAKLRDILLRNRISEN